MRKSYPLSIIILISLVLSFLTSSLYGQSTETIPLPEHPRPDFRRELWQNLNGTLDFRFDPQNVGEKEKWFCYEEVIVMRSCSLN